MAFKALSVDKVTSVTAERDKKWSKDRPGTSMLRGEEGDCGRQGRRRIRSCRPRGPGQKAFQGLRCFGEAGTMKPEGRMPDLAMRRSPETRSFHECQVRVCCSGRQKWKGECANSFREFYWKGSRGIHVGSKEGFRCVVLSLALERVTPQHDHPVKTVSKRGGY